MAIDLYDYLSKDKLDEAGELISQFYDEHYRNIQEDVEFKTEEVEKESDSQKESGDIQLTFKEVLE